MAGEAAAAGLGGIANVVSTWMQARYDKRAQETQNRANRELAEYQYSKDLEMWNKGNLYNSPTEQMRRLKEAGLNPNLVYGSGATGNMASQLPKYQSPTVSHNFKPPVDPLAMLGAYQNFRLTQAEIDLRKAQVMNIEQETRNKGQMGDILGMRKQDWWNTWEWKLQQEQEKAWGMQQRRKQGEQLFPHQLQIQQQTGRLRESEADMFDWSRWTDILSKFGVKLPSFRGKR